MSIASRMQHKLTHCSILLYASTALVVFVRLDAERLMVRHYDFASRIGAVFGTKTCRNESNVHFASSREVRNRYPLVFPSHRALVFNSTFKSPCWWERDQLHCLPSTFIIGVAKCGTSDLYVRLCQYTDAVWCSNRSLRRPIGEVYFWSGLPPRRAF